MNNEMNEYCYNPCDRNEFQVSCTAIGLFLALLFGAVLGTIFYFGLITAIPILLWVIFGVGAFSVVTTIALAAFQQFLPSKICLCRVRNLLLIGGLGAFVTSVIALLSAVTAFSVLSAILVGVAGFFAFLAIAALVCFVLCSAKCCL